MNIVTKSHKGDFCLQHNGETLNQLNYTNWFTGKAKADFQKQQIEIYPKNIWQNKYYIYKNGDNAGSISVNWKGFFKICLNALNGQEINYIFKPRGVWKLRFELYTEDESLLLTMHAINNWRKLNYDYQVESLGNTTLINETELLIYCGYAANQYLAMISAS